MKGRTPEQIEASAARDADIVRLRREGQTFQQIAERFGFSRQYAHTRYWELINEHTAAQVHEHRAESLERLDWLRREAVAILRRDHVVVSQGRVMKDAGPDGVERPLLDDGPKIQALRELRQIEQLQAELVGSKAPVKTDLGGGVELRVVIVGADTEKMT